MKLGYDLYCIEEEELLTLLKYTNKIDQEYSVSLTSEEKVDIVTTEGSDYVIIFSSDSRQTDRHKSCSVPCEGSW